MAETCVAGVWARRYDPALTSESDLRRIMTFSKRFVQALHIRQLPSHMDLSVLFECMVK